MPVGTVIAWPMSSDPAGIWSGFWLECNGQAIDAGKYPKLAKLMSAVPDYRGVFLRGLGGNSSSLGQLQGDTARALTGFWGTYPVGNSPKDSNPFYSTQTSNEPASVLSAKSDWDYYLYKYRYRLVGDAQNGYSLEESIESPNIVYRGYSGQVNFDVSRAWPTSNEFRPINKAVRYMIKAK